MQLLKSNHQSLATNETNHSTVVLSKNTNYRLSSNTEDVVFLYFIKPVIIKYLDGISDYADQMSMRVSTRDIATVSCLEHESNEAVWGYSLNLSQLMTKRQARLIENVYFTDNSYLISNKLFCKLFLLVNLDPYQVQSIEPNICNQLVAELLQTVNKPLPRLAFSLTKQQFTCITDCLKFIAQERDDIPSIKSIADYCHCSSSHLSRLIKNYCGLSLQQYLKAYRIRHALTKLPLNDCYDLASFAVAHGFSSHSHMTMLFREAFGFTPSELRNHWRSQNIYKLFN